MQEQLKLQNQLCFRLYTVSRLITQAYYPYLTEIGLTYPQYLVMLVLWEEDGLPVNDIARRLYLETNTVTPLLKRMEAGGFLSRERGSGDGRQVLVRLTEQGRALEAKAAGIPYRVGSAASCRTITAETAPTLYAMLDNLIETLSGEAE